MTKIKRILKAIKASNTFVVENRKGSCTANLCVDTNLGVYFYNNLDGSCVLLERIPYESLKKATISFNTFACEEAKISLQKTILQPTITPVKI